MQIVGALNIAWMIAAFIVGIFLCVPVQGFWDPTISSRCVNFNALFLSNEAITIALDLVVLFLPVWYIARIQSSVKHKVSISITFLLGLIATLVSALRLWRLVEAHHMNPEDVTYVETDAALWAIVELNIWVLVASIPTLRPLVRKLKDEQFGPAVARLSPRSTISSYWSLDSLKRKLWSSRSRDDAVDSEVALAGITGGGQASLASDSNSGPRTNPSSKHWDEEALRRSMGKIGMRRDVEVSAE
ncbi:MAG: hypothetical protein M1831_000423 [Alyxoria varia]|nr:MAG: hypothetical protein M1831_000423 [Alyxoria varia]